MLPIGLLGGRSVEPGLEDTTELRARLCTWSIPCVYMVRRPDDLVLTVQLWPPWGYLVQHIDLTSVVLASGGTSYFFQCPGLPGSTGCGRRVRNLHLPVFGTKALACRRCHGLCYRSQHEQMQTPTQIRAWLERQKARIGYPAAGTP